MPPSDDLLEPSAILGALLSDTRGIVARLLAEPLRDRAELAAELSRALGEATALSGTHDFPLVDSESGQAVARRCQEWLSRWDQLGPRARKLVQVAVVYYAMREDGEDDLKSPFGYDDDIEVINAVAAALGEPPLELWGPERPDDPGLRS